MRIPALLGHATELLRVIIKSYQPSDKIMSDYFRSKKYIGSSERRFLSELVFATLRSKAIAEHCANSFFVHSERELSKLNSEKEFLLISCTTYLFEIIKELHPILFPSLLLKKLHNFEDDDFIQQVVDSFSDTLNIDKESSLKFFINVKNSFDELNLKIQNISHDKKIITIEDITLIQNRYSMPSWILESWLYNNHSKMSVDDVFSLSESLLYPAPLTIRVNLSYLTREEVINTLRRNEIDCEPCRLSPSGIIISKRTQLNTLDIFKKGLIEVQDEGSQIICYALCPDENEKVLDACAGAGGKTLHIADIQKNSGEIVANDVDFRKLRELLKRASRSGFNSIRTVKLNNSEKDTHHLGREYIDELFDRVLVDAPCSGMGTVRRMPMQKWRLTPDILKKHSDKQLMILEYYSKFVKDGGLLLYSTCSLMFEENEEVVVKFLATNKNFKPYPLKPALDRYNISVTELSEDSNMLRLSPDRHGCDGFFIAEFIKED